MSGMTFLLGMLSPRTNVKGMMVGYIGGMIPLTCSLIGMFFIPRHKSFYNSTGKVFTLYFCPKRYQLNVLTESENSKK